MCDSLQTVLLHTLVQEREYVPIRLSNNHLRLQCIFLYMLPFSIVLPSLIHLLFLFVNMFAYNACLPIYLTCDPVHALLTHLPPSCMHGHGYQVSEHRTAREV